MSLTTDDLLKIKNLFEPEFEKIHLKLKELDEIKITVNQHSDMLAEILDRLDRTELPFIVHHLDKNTEDIRIIKTKLNLS